MSYGFWQRDCLLQPDMGAAAIILFFPGLLYILAGMPFLEILARFSRRQFVLGISGCCFCLSRRHMAAIMGSVAPIAEGGVSDCTEFNRSQFRWILGRGPGKGVYKFLYLLNSNMQILCMQFSARSLNSSVPDVVMCLFMEICPCWVSFARQLKQPYESLLVYTD